MDFSLEVPEHVSLNRSGRIWGETLGWGALSGGGIAGGLMLSQPIGLAAAVGAGAVAGALGLYRGLARLRRVHAEDGRLYLYWGISGFFRSYPLDDFDTLRLHLGPQSTNFCTCNLWRILDNAGDAELRLVLKHNNGKELTLSSKQFDDGAFHRFLEDFQNYFVHQAGLPSERMRLLLHQADKLASADRHRVNDLTQNLIKVYESAYQVHILSYYDKATLDAPEVVLYHKSGNEYHYYKRNYFKYNTSRANQDLAREVIASTEENILIVKRRLKFYENIQRKLGRMAAETQQREQLEAATGRLRKLQDENLRYRSGFEELDHQAEVLFQLEELTRNLQQVDNMQQAEALKQHLELFEKYSASEDQQLRALNAALKRP